MATFKVINLSGEPVGEIELADAVFGAPVKQHLLWEVVRAQRAAKRAGNACTKGRSEVRGGGKKPYRQKGTGRARQGSSRSPNHVGGGTVFGPKPRSYVIALPKKVRRGALCSVVSLRGKEQSLTIVDSFQLPEIQTKNLVQVLDRLFETKRLTRVIDERKRDLHVLIVEDKDNVNLALSARNLPLCKVLPPEGLNVYDVLRHEKLVLTTATARDVEQRLKA
jgi:large subunit ribosomal protein L4